MNRKGDTDTRTWFVPMGVAILVLAVVFLGVVFILGGFIDKGKLFPGFNQTQTAILGDEIIGIDLSDDLLLKYYTGSSWKLIEGEKYETNSGKVIDTKDVKDELKRFYLVTDRRGKDSILIDEIFRRLTVLPIYGISGTDFKNDNAFPNAIIDYLDGDYEVRKELFGQGTPGERIRTIWIRFGNPGLYMKVKEEGVGPFSELESRDLYVDLLGKIYEIDVRKVGTVLALSPIKDAPSYKNAIDEIIVSWRDGILEGGEFEKFITLKVNGIDAQYTVKRTDDKLFVDLNNPASGEEKYFTVEIEEGGEQEIDPGVIEISLDFALQEAEKRTGKYSSNKVFVDWLYENRFISSDEYVEINGEGLWNLQGDMKDVVDLLRQRKAKIGG